MTPTNDFSWLRYGIRDLETYGIDTSDLDLEKSNDRLVIMVGDMPELARRMNIALAINEGFLIPTARMKLVKVFDQGEPFATLVAHSQEQADLWAMQLRACWGTDEDSLFEIQIDDANDIDATIQLMEG